MKYYLDKINNNVFVIDGFEYEARENQDIEITEKEFNNFLEARKPVSTKEELLSDLRMKRTFLLEAFDKWEKAVLRGREVDDTNILTWYYELLDLKEHAFVEIPERVQYYL